MPKSVGLPRFWAVVREIRAWRRRRDENIVENDTVLGLDVKRKRCQKIEKDFGIILGKGRIAGKEMKEGLTANI